MAERNHVNILWVHHLVACCPLKDVTSTMFSDIREREDSFFENEFLIMSIRSVDEMLCTLFNYILNVRIIVLIQSTNNSSKTTMCNYLG